MSVGMNSVHTLMNRCRVAVNDEFRQPARGTVADVEADRRRLSFHESEGLAVLVNAEGEVLVRAVEQIAEMNPRRGATQCVVTAR